LYPRLRELIRANGLVGCTFVEPFAGGAGAALSLLVTGQVSRLVINDLDPAVSAFWRMAISSPDALISKIWNVPLDVNEWARQKVIFMSMSRGEADTDALGFATFYLNRTNRSGVLNGGPIGGLDQSGNYKIDARFNRGTLAERVRIIGLYSNKITVLSEDGIDVIKRFTRRSDTFVYADPPYFEKAGSLYLNAFTDRDHLRLAKVLNRRADRNWVLTYDNVPQVGDLYADRRRQAFDLFYSAHRVTRATEVMVLSDALNLTDVGP
jgi:DNA adenine methylase